MAESFQINPMDNVATLLEKVDAGPILVCGPAGQYVLTTLQPIELGHKMALCDISANTAIVKYGVMIGRSTKLILQGEWVHLHNCSSCIDKRSGGFDVHTGLPGVKAYE